MSDIEVDLPEWVIETLRADADKRGITLNDLLLEILREAVDG